MSARHGHRGGDAKQSPQEAAEAIQERLGRLQRLSRDAIRAATLEGLTAHETSLATGFDRSAIQPRISELCRKGLVIASGKRRPNPSGKTATVWIASEYADALSQAPVC